MPLIPASTSVDAVCIKGKSHKKSRPNNVGVKADLNTQEMTMERQWSDEMKIVLNRWLTGSSWSALLYLDHRTPAGQTALLGHEGSTAKQRRRTRCNEAPNDMKRFAGGRTSLHKLKPMMVGTAVLRIKDCRGKRGGDDSTPLVLQRLLVPSQDQSRYEHETPMVGCDRMPSPAQPGGWTSVWATWTQSSKDLGSTRQRLQTCRRTGSRGTSSCPRGETARI